MASEVNIRLRYLKPTDTDLAAIAKELNEGDSEVSSKTFTEATLKEFLSDPGRFYLLATIDGKIAGAIHGYDHIHPAGPKYIYVDEVDTVEQFRRQGVAKTMMQEVFRYAGERGAEEVWLGADDGNDPADALYRSLSPSETEPGTIYSYKIKPRN